MKKKKALPNDTTPNLPGLQRIGQPQYDCEQMDTAAMFGALPFFGHSYCLMK